MMSYQLSLADIIREGFKEEKKVQNFTVGSRQIGQFYTFLKKLVGPGMFDRRPPSAANWFESDLYFYVISCENLHTIYEFLVMEQLKLY